MKKTNFLLTLLAFFTVFAAGSQTTVDLKVFLEGPFSGGTMTPSLNGLGYLPLEQPYHASPWFYYGSEAVTTIPNADIVDWVLVELRQTVGAASSAIQDSAIARQVGLLLKDGSIVDTDGSSPLQFNVEVTSNLYAVIRYRNHVSIMSGDPLQMSGGVYTFDFTTGADKVFGGINGHKQLTTGIWGMFSGDGNGDAQINNSDKIEVWKPQSGNSGYLTGDFNLNGQVDNVDKNDYWKINGGKSSQVPLGSINTPPVAIIQVSPPLGSTITEFTLDANASYDGQSKPALLAVRWDFENDGIWDTPFSYIKITTHIYSISGDYSIRLEVIDVGGLADTATFILPVVQITGVPCPGTPTITYEGQVYHTVQIGTQCWLKENLNVGTMIIGSQLQIDNQITEKYCYDNDPVNCQVYGGLYQWDEMMQYVFVPGVKGICPDGWHLPTEDEYCTLKVLIDPSVICDAFGWSGTDIGTKLKSTAGWEQGGNGTDAFGFMAIPAGYRALYGNFDGITGGCFFWTSNVLFPDAWLWFLTYYSTQTFRCHWDDYCGQSVRCLKD
jgi:uncharacterized protein (TIGR02145 family)